MGMSTNGVRGRRCGCHAPPPAAAGGGGEEPGAAGGRPGRAARAGGGGGGAAGRARRRTRAPARQACPTAKPAAAGPPAFSTVLRPARAAMTCRPRAWDGQRVAPVVPPAVEVVPVRHRRSRRCAERRVGRRSRSRLRAGVVRESTLHDDLIATEDARQCGTGGRTGNREGTGRTRRPTPRDAVARLVVRAQSRTCPTKCLSRRFSFSYSRGASHESSSLRRPPTEAPSLN